MTLQDSQSSAYALASMNSQIIICSRWRQFAQDFLHKSASLATTCAHAVTYQTNIPWCHSDLIARAGACLNGKEAGPLKRFAKILKIALYKAFLFGCVGFVVGFFGPMLIAMLVGSNANLGPLWGIFILGPGGVIYGFFVGAFGGYKRIRKNEKQVVPAFASTSPSLFIWVR